MIRSFLLLKKLEMK